MKRIHLFEFEDLKWFPNSIRDCLTRGLMAFHKLLKSDEQISELTHKALQYTNENHIIDLCSGSGDPMLEVKERLEKKYNTKVKLTLSDLYPHQKISKKINNLKNDFLKYETKPVDAANVNPDLKGLRTMICSFHHMKPNIAKKILKDAKDNEQPILIYEISDNSYPIWLWWLAFPFPLLLILFITPIIRPLTWQQLVFTYLIPIIPLTFAWDGAVSNARTYTLKDLDILLGGLNDENYSWEKGTLKGKGGKKLYLIGKPSKT